MRSLVRETMLTALVLTVTRVAGAAAPLRFEEYPGAETLAARQFRTVLRSEAARGGYYRWHGATLTQIQAIEHSVTRRTNP